MNKDIRNVHAFLNWAAKNRFVALGLEIRKVKVPQEPVVSLSPKQVRDLLIATECYPTVRLRVLLAVTTGLRRGDIEAICIDDIDQVMAAQQDLVEPVARFDPKIVKMAPPGERPED